MVTTLLNVELSTLTSDNIFDVLEAEAADAFVTQYAQAA